MVVFINLYLAYSPVNSEKVSCLREVTLKLGEELGVTDDKPYFLNPSPEYEGERIYFVMDVVHIAKLFRSHLIDQGKHGIFNFVDL